MTLDRRFVQRSFALGDDYPLHLREEVFPTTIGQIVRDDQRVWLELQFTPDEYARFESCMNSMKPDIETRGTRTEWLRALQWIWRARFRRFQRRV